MKQLNASFQGLTPLLYLTRKRKDSKFSFAPLREILILTSYDAT